MSMLQHYEGSRKIVPIVLRVGICVRALAITAIRSVGKALYYQVTRRSYSRKALLGQALAELCESLGTTYIKLGQLLSTRYDLIPPEILKPLERLQDHVAPFAPEYVPILLTKHLGHPPSKVFVTLDSHPISSASVACVYRATLHNGQTVAVKIRRPGILRTVEIDLQLMRLGAWVLVRLAPLRSVPMLEVIEELGKAISQQLDFQREAENNRRFRASFAHDQHIRWPVLIEEYCTDAVLVMDFIPDLIRVDALHEQGVDYRPALVTALKALYQMIFIDGFIHCDLHPGNMYFQPNGNVVFLDTGFVKEFRPEEQALFARFFLGIVINNGRDCAKIMHDTALSIPPAFKYDEFEQSVSDLIARSSGLRASEFQVAGFALQLFDIQRRFGLRASPNFVMAILALLVFEGIVKTYCTDLDFQYEAQPYVIRAFFSSGNSYG